MNIILKSIVLASIGLPFASCVNSPKSLNTSELSLVKENHVEMNFGGTVYILDSYIKPFQNPYHVKIKRKDGGVIDKKTAIDAAIEYIKPRGCSRAPSRRQELDRSNTDKTEWIIGINC